MYKTVEAIYENGEIRLLEDLGVKRAKLYIIVIDDEKDKEAFQWDLNDPNEKKILTTVTARTIKEWQSEEEDRIWK
ncbi:MAG TPA: DUF104 domain-containing protein [Candidatus Eremiobacteraeota bacterium]|nr:MAG: hypothetical protein BWY64_00281 [bacterium ADurb.Bin363]HPZ06751.1 DUF104 domain-containing protein [Candidatus Eremiobacteraeota bacterium]